jgi:hypothetical protein
LIARSIGLSGVAPSATAISASASFAFAASPIRPTLTRSAMAASNSAPLPPSGPVCTQWLAVAT